MTSQRFADDLPQNIKRYDARIQKLEGEFFHTIGNSGIRYAAAHGESMLEIKRAGVFVYWLLDGAQYKAIAASRRRKVGPMEKIRASIFIKAPNPAGSAI